MFGGAGHVNAGQVKIRVKCGWFQHNDVGFAGCVIDGDKYWGDGVGSHENDDDDSQTTKNNNNT